jgi:hypothetical protein
MTISFTKADIDTAVWETNSEVELREDYSGRGMYGKNCWAVVGAPRNLADFEAQLAKTATIKQYDGALEGSVDVEAVLDVFMEKLTELRVRRYEDSMGMSQVWYYPSIKLED